MGKACCFQLCHFRFRLQKLPINKQTLLKVNFTRTNLTDQKTLKRSVTRLSKINISLWGYFHDGFLCVNTEELKIKYLCHIWGEELCCERFCFVYFVLFVLFIKCEWNLSICVNILKFATLGNDLAEYHFRTCTDIYLYIHIYTWIYISY